MLTTLAAQNWAMFVLRGVIALALGVLAFAAPGPTLAALVFVFAAYAIFDGVVAIALGFAIVGSLILFFCSALALAVFGGSAVCATSSFYRDRGARGVGESDTSMVKQYLMPFLPVM